MKLTPAESVGIIYPEILSLVETEVAHEIREIAPKAIAYLQNCEKAHPGFLNIKADIDATLVDILQGALAWANVVVDSTDDAAPASTEASTQA